MRKRITDAQEKINKSKHKGLYNIFTMINYYHSKKNRVKPNSS